MRPFCVCSDETRKSALTLGERSVVRQPLRQADRPWSTGVGTRLQGGPVRLSLGSWGALQGLLFAKKYLLCGGFVKVTE